MWRPGAPAGKPNTRIYASAAKKDDKADMGSDWLIKDEPYTSIAQLSKKNLANQHHTDVPVWTLALLTEGWSNAEVAVRTYCNIRPRQLLYFRRS